MKDYYQILGVSSTAPSAEIKRVYRRLAMLYHPDRNHSPEAEQIFKEINEAYDVLGSDESRQWYDYKRQSTSSSTAYTDKTRTPSKPAHRDPAYHRRRAPRPVNTAPSRNETLAHYLPYFFWMNQVGVAMMFIFLMDYSLPLTSSTERIQVLYSVPMRGVLDQGMLTTHGHRIQIVSDFDIFKEGDEIELHYTPIFKTIMQTKYNNQVFETADRGIYGPIFVFPVGLFITSILGLIFRSNIEYAFNLSIISGVLFIFVLTFILMI
jgi:hypothetical protein